MVSERDEEIESNRERDETIELRVECPLRERLLNCKYVPCLHICGQHIGPSSDPGQHYEEDVSLRQYFA